MYWEGLLPTHIGICLESVRRSLSSRCRFQFVEPSNLNRYLGSSFIHANMARLREPAHRADCIRAALLATHGGFYFDADTIGLRCPAEVASNHDLVYCVWNNPPRRVLNGYLYAQPGSELAREWLAGINQRLASVPQSGRCDWTGFGEQILTPLVDSAPAGATRQVHRDTFLPLDIDSKQYQLFERHDPASFITPSSVCFGLNNSWMVHHHPHEMQAVGSPVAAASGLLVHRLFHDAQQRMAAA